jgi:hypothetical protein
MNETHAIGGQQETTAGGVILVIISFLAAILVIAALIYAEGTGGRHKAALAAAGCEPNLSPSGLQCTTVRMLASRYMTITVPARQQLNTDVSAVYIANKGHHLAAAETALMAEVTSENAFGTSLARFPFPPAILPIAKALLRANHDRAVLTAEQARSSSLTQLRSFNHRVDVASAAVRTEMKLIHKALDSPPRANQEP